MPSRGALTLKMSGRGEITTEKVSEAVRVPSVAVRVIVEVPYAFNTGTIVTVQFGTVPLKRIPPFATNKVLLEAPTIEVEQVNVESGSVIEKLILETVSSTIAWSSIVEITGGF